MNTVRRALTLASRVVPGWRAQPAEVHAPPTPVLHTQRSWLWVVSEPEDAAVREPGDRGWWTCDRNTRAGDFALVYRAAPHKHIAYLVGAVSDARPLEPDDDLPKARGFACEYELLSRFPRPLGLPALRADAALNDWTALRIDLRGAVHPIPSETWQHLVATAGLQPERLRELMRAGILEYRIEKEIERYLIREPDRFARVGYRGLRLVQQQRHLPSGRIPDLIYRTTSGRLLVVELKRGPVRQQAVDQLRGYLQEVWALDSRRKRPLGMLVGSEIRPDAAAALRRLAGTEFVRLDDLGLRPTLDPTPRLTPSKDRR
ncbi:endonuclease NucS domain-containing protein [Blastococcus sp. SYSU D00820]